MKKILILTFILPVAVCALPWLLRVWVDLRVQDRVYGPGPSRAVTVPYSGVALVLGAGLWRDGSPTPVLYDRVATAVDLYKAGTVKKILMSGDNRFAWHNEPEAMRQLAVQLGVPNEDIVLDYAGRRTYDSCYRAREIFGVEQLTVVTQRFHINRAVYLCDALGVEAVGVVADRRVYRAPQRQWWLLRETAALVNAWFDIHLIHPQPVMGEKSPIELADR
jgi:SanA protein